MGRKNDRKRGRGGAGQNRAESEAYLRKNAAKPGVEVMPSGLQVEQREEGSGPSPDTRSTVVVNQRILLVDGTVIKDTYHGTRPDEFTMEEAIPGLQEGLVLMKEGGKCRFVVPHELAWGKRGAGDRIGPYAALIFDIRLEKVCT